MRKISKKSKVAIVSVVVGLLVSALVYAGTGRCIHAGCHCSRYVSAHDGGHCVCGHWDYLHK